MPDITGKKISKGSEIMLRGVKQWKAIKSDKDLTKLFAALALECAKEIPGLNFFVGSGKHLV
ncbi:TPA: hypothetical protein RKY22_004900 [Klebsiella michiganensis]|uniref:hypothetical protein n=1 Tax=Klebsiella quasipneumoniae TaxID=1463165 RepID=UPI0010F2D9F6|nr:hypothetical protein [Klebsiella quasipneumoniae]UDC52443.1 hypothetical protein LGM29_29225 [Klebsiella quasipneumoniae subsp. similipneumoniae]VGO91109.1 hypothetical protein SB00610_00147 [Klebsiella quasipneumoniae subsp. similipneumoniae]HDW0214317.1 hypothetical protein [Klebsiella michiganensis]